MLRKLLVIILSIYLISSQEGETDTIDSPEEGDDPEITSSWVAKQENEVYVLDPTNFDGFIESQEVVMVEFYAPWCGHCKKLAPEYDAAALQMKDSGVKAVLAKVDANEHQEIGSKYGVQGFPTLKIFKKGTDEPITYEGGRNTFEIVEKMKELSDPNWEPPKSEVMELTSDNFDETINSQQIMLVEFFAPWCGHCKKLKPDYEKAARELKSEGIILGTVDATVEKDIAKKFDVTGYPTLKIFRNGKVSEFKGGRTAREIAKTMITERDPHTVELTTSALRKDTEKPSTVKIIGLFPGLSTDSIEYQLFEELTNDFRSSYDCSHSFDASFASKSFKVSSPTLLVVYPHTYVAKKEQPFASTPIASDSSRSSLDEFISSNNKPLVGDFDCPNCDQIYNAVDTVRVYTSKDYGKGFDKNTKYWQEKAAIVARKYAGKGLYFVMCDEGRQAADMNSMKLTDLGVETVFGIKTAGGEKYSPDEEELDDMDDFKETLEEFVDKYLAGKLQARRKSAPIPKKQTGPVTVVVGSTFDKIVGDASRDVLVEFYAPWCGHCKALEPKYSQLATDLKSETNLVIAKIDATTNDYPKTYKVDGFPTIYFVPGGGEPVLYDGAREVDDLKKFVKDNAVVAFGDTDVKEEL